MTRRIKWNAILILALVLITIPNLAWGVGYEITEESTKAMGLADAFAARADDPSAVYYNTAGLSQARKPELSLGLTFVNVGMMLENNKIRNRDITREFYVPNLYFSTPILKDKLAFGLGIYSPYGLGTEWDEDGPTKYAAIKSEMQTIFITPALAWKIIPEVSVGVGLSYIDSEAEMTRKYPFSVIAPLYSLSSPDANVRLTGKDESWGWTAGIMVHPVDKLSLGFSYRSGTILKYEGNLEVDHISKVAQGLGASHKSSYDSSAKLELPLPERYSFGIAYDLFPNWKVEFDYERIRWSALNTLEINIKDENAFFSDTETKKDWSDTNAFKLGTEVQVTDNLALRTGGFYYQSPVPDKTLDPMIPDADRYGFALGLGYKIGSFTVDAAYTQAFSKPRTVKNGALEANTTLLKAAGLTPGDDRYENKVYLASVNLGYSF